MARKPGAKESARRRQCARMTREALSHFIYLETKSRSRNPYEFNVDVDFSLEARERMLQFAERWLAKLRYEMNLESYRREGPE